MAVKNTQNIKEIYLRRNDLSNIARHSLPSGYTLVPYCEGHQEIWHQILEQCDQYKITPRDLFEKYHSYKEALVQRQFYLYNRDSKPIGTATAWYDEFCQESYGRVHWVGIIPAYQGKGLAKPLLSFILHKLLEFGHSKTFLRTLNIRHNAIALYLYFGFEPVIRNNLELGLWQDIAKFIKHPKLVKPAINCL